MILDASTRTQILVDMTLSFDPTGSTVELQVDGGAWHAATWQDTATTIGVGKDKRWMQSARTSDYFAGPLATAAGATVLTAGKHLTQTRVTLGGQELANNSSPIYVE
jgi:hypothetical protein